MLAKDENDVLDMGLAVAGIDYLRRELNCPVLVNHHIGWTNKERERGASVLRAACDTVLELTKLGDTGANGQETTRR